MIQEAILFTKKNADVIVSNLNDYPSIAMLMSDYEYMFETHDTLVLCRDINSNGFASVSYVITPAYFQVNRPCPALNDKTFTKIAEF